MTMKTKWRSRPALALGALLLATPASGAAQQADDALVERPLASREALQALASRLEQGKGPVADNSLLARVRTRLEEGDLRPGDRVLLEVEGEKALSDTFTVGPARDLRLPPPTVGTLSLKGVLRSEVQTQLATYVARFIQNPVVRARPLLRLSVQGEVVRAGIYGVPASAVLADALMAAGGTTARANMKKLRIERDGKPILEGQALRQAIAAGRTVDEANLRDGDQFVVAERSNTTVHDNLNFLWVVLSIGGGIYGLTRAF